MYLKSKWMGKIKIKSKWQISASIPYLKKNSATSNRKELSQPDKDKKEQSHRQQCDQSQSNYSAWRS